MSVQSNDLVVKEEISILQMLFATRSDRKNSCISTYVTQVKSIFRFSFHKPYSQQLLRECAVWGCE